MGGLSNYHAATPKVEECNGGFYLHYANNDFDKILTGPVNPGQRFSTSDVSFNSRSINQNYQNEGTNFVMSADCRRVVAAGNFRQKGGAGVGVWASDNRSGSYRATILAKFRGTEHGGAKGEGHQQPNIAIDEETGDAYVVYFADIDNLAYYHVSHNGTWSEQYRLYPEQEGNQGYYRNGHSVTDIPGKGVVACVSHNNVVYLRTLGADPGSTANIQPVLPNTGMEAGEIAVVPGANSLVARFDDCYDIHIFNASGSVL
jgi:hypothetical protein